MLRRRFLPLAFLVSALLVSALLVGSCSSGDSGGGAPVAVTATDDVCNPETSIVPTGKVTFTVKNDGSDTTEMYVKTEADKVLGEVENIGPGTSRKLTVTLDPGNVKLVCKPGQSGDGITTLVRAAPAETPTT